MSAISEAIRALFGTTRGTSLVRHSNGRTLADMLDGAQQVVDVRRTTELALADEVEVVVPFDETDAADLINTAVYVEYDPVLDGLKNTSLTESAICEFESRIKFTGQNGIGTRRVKFTHVKAAGGSVDIVRRTQNATSGDDTEIYGNSKPITLAPGDYVQCKAYSNTVTAGVSVDTQSTFTAKVMFTGTVQDLTQYLTAIETRQLLETKGDVFPTIAEIKSATGFIVGDKAQAYRNGVLVNFEAVASGGADEYGKLAGQGVDWVVQAVNNTYYISHFGFVSGNGSAVSNAAVAKLTAGQTLVFDVAAMTVEAPIERTGIPERCTIDFADCEFTADAATMSGLNLFNLYGVDNDKGTRTLTAPNYTKPASPPDPNTYMLGVVKYELDDASGIEAGDWISFHSTRRFDNAGGKETYETQRVWEVDGNTIYTGAQAKVAFETGDSVQVRGLTDGITIKGGRFDGNGSVAQAAVFVRYFNQPVVDGLDVRDCKLFGVYVAWCCQDTVRNCTFKKAGVPASPEAGYQGDFGYGLIHARNCYSKVYDCVGREGWHSFEAADGQRDISYYNCTTFSDGHGFSTHENCVSVVYNNCSSQARLPSVNRARYVSFIGGHYEKTANDATFSASGWEFSLDGVTITSARGGNLIRPNGQDVSLLTEPAGITPNVSVRVKNCTIISRAEDATATIICGHSLNNDYVEFSDNTIKGLSEQGLNVALNAIVVECRGNTFYTQSDNIGILNVNGSETARIAGNNFIHRIAGSGLADPISLFGSTDGNVYIENNSIDSTSGLRFVVRSYVADPTNINVFFNGNSINCPAIRGVIGKMKVTFSNNVWDESITNTLAYNTAAPTETLIQDSQGDVFKKYGTTYAGLMPTSAASIPVGFVYNNAGVLTVKS